MRGLVLVFIVALAIGLIPIALDVVPPAGVHDEFAYLLQADTFAHGRLTNPSPQHPEFFETMHVLVRPTYTAKFPPAQAMTLAAAMKLGFNPIVGVVVTMAAACAAVAWMLRTALPARWAVVGGLMAAMHPLILTWEQSRWGGGVAMLGGSLLAGATLRTLRRPKLADGLIFGAGAAILANSRPFEGLLLGTACVLLMLVVSRRHGRFRAARILLPASIVLAPVIAGMLYYNHRVTGNALQLPYAEHARQYMIAPLFWWQSPVAGTVAEPIYGNDVLARFHGEAEWREYADQRGLSGFIRGAARKLGEVARDWLSPPAIAAAVAIALWRVRRRPHVRIALVVCALIVAAHLATTPWFRAHYLAPLGGFFFLIVAVGMREWYRLGRGRWGAIVVALLLSVHVATAAWQISGLITRPPIAGVPRELAIAELRSHPAPAGHLVFVRYVTGPQTILEWVYNSAELDRQPVVWARDLGEPKNAELRRALTSRKAWLLEVQGLEYRLSPIN